MVELLGLLGRSGGSLFLSLGGNSHLLLCVSGGSLLGLGAEVGSLGLAGG